MPKKSKIKEEILEFINSNKNSISHQEIMQHTKSMYDRVSIYRALDKLINEKLIHKFVDIEGVHRYSSQLNTSYLEQFDKNNIIVKDNLHAHFHCHICKITTCIELKLENINNLNILNGYTINNYNLIIDGKCKNCNSNNI